MESLPSSTRVSNGDEDLVRLARSPAPDRELEPASSLRESPEPSPRPVSTLTYTSSSIQNFSILERLHLLETRHDIIIQALSKIPSSSYSTLQDVIAKSESDFLNIRRSSEEKWKFDLPSVATPFLRVSDFAALPSQAGEMKE